MCENVIKLFFWWGGAAAHIVLHNSACNAIKFALYFQSALLVEK